MISGTTICLLTKVSMTTYQKTCFKCSVEKPISHFYKHGGMADGHLNKCKECTKKDVSLNYRENIDHYKQYEKERANLPHRVKARELYLQTDEGRKSASQAKARYAKKYPLKRTATSAVSNALRDGRLIKGPCEVCGKKKVEAHHDDYSRPLNIRWLCKKHHTEWHKENEPRNPF